METLKILNSSPIQQNFLGFNGIYHGYAGMGDDCGRILNEELCELEADRAKDQNLKIARTFYGWVNWDKEKQEFDWNHPDFLAFCKWIERMKVRGIDVAINFGSIPDIMSQGWRGKSPFTVGGDWNASLKKYTDWVCENLHQILDVRGLDNLKYILYFTEPQAYGNQPVPKGTTDPFDVWYQASKAIEIALKEKGYYDRVTVVGPQEVIGGESQMMKWVKENHPDIVPIYSSHNYSWLILKTDNLPDNGEVDFLYKAGARWYVPVSIKPNTKYTLSFYAKIKYENPKVLSGYLLCGLFKKNSLGMFTSGGNPTDRLGRFSTAMLEAARISDDFKRYEFEIETADDADDALLGFFSDVRPEQGWIIQLGSVVLKETGSGNAIELFNGWNGFPDAKMGAGTHYKYFDIDVKKKIKCLDDGDPFWYDEYNCLGYRVNDAVVKRPEHPYHGTNLCAVRLAFLNNGVQNSFMWSLFDQQWPYNHSNNNDDFYDGDHRCGVMPSLIRSKVPYPAYFATRITSLVNGDANSKIFKGEHTGEIKTAMVKNSDGNVTVLLVNEAEEPIDFEIEFENPLNLDLNCYVYNPETVVCSEEIPALKADFTVSNVTGTLKGTIPAMGVMAYSTK
ncbi:MAG: hypothetical protein E7551_09420 [Ruminococcaceae bacterium]|nr:hypothetical protein [Oscillospiraceae bacterium]